MCLNSPKAPFHLISTASVVAVLSTPSLTTTMLGFEDVICCSRDNDEEPEEVYPSVNISASHGTYQREGRSVRCKRVRFCDESPFASASKHPCFSALRCSAESEVYLAPSPLQLPVNFWGESTLKEKRNEYATYYAPVQTELYHTPIASICIQPSEWHSGALLQDRFSIVSRFLL